MKVGWPQREPDPVEEEFANQRARNKEALDRIDRVLREAYDVVPDDAMIEIRRTEHAAGREHG